jgi:phage regulator Rha-like protein
MSNELMTISKMSSMEIAEVTGKQHQHIMRDIRDEIEKLENSGIETQSKFGLRERDGLTGKIPYYELTKEGVLQSVLT